MNLSQVLRVCAENMHPLMALVHSPVIAQAILESGAGVRVTSHPSIIIILVEVWKQVERKIRKHENAGGVHTGNAYNNQ